MLRGVSEGGKKPHLYFLMGGSLAKDPHDHARTLQHAHIRMHHLECCLCIVFYLAVGLWFLREPPLCYLAMTEASLSHERMN